MAKENITQYDTNPANNTDIDSVDISENCAPSGINNAIRSVLSHLADLNAGNVALGTIKVDNLQLDSNSITSLDTNGDIAITPNGTGDVLIDGLKHPQADGSAGQFLKTDGSGQLAFATVDTSIADGAITIGKMADDSVGAAELVDNSVGAAAINISGNGTAGQVIVSDGDGSFSYQDSSSPFSPTTASGTTPTLSLATHNFFDLGTLSGNTTLAFSNIPTAKRWFVDVQGAGNSNGLTAVSSDNLGSGYTGTDFANLRGGGGVALKPDGSVLFVVGGTNASPFKQFIKSYALGTNFIVNSISLPPGNSPTAVFDLSGQIYDADQTDQYAFGLDFRSDGTMFYIIDSDPAGGNNRIHQYTCSSAFDVSTASLTASKNLYSNDTNKTRGLHLRQNGADIYFANDTDNRIERWTMSTPYSISTASSTSTFDISGTTTAPTNVVLSSDGTKMLVNQFVFTLSTPFDITSAGSATTVSSANSAAGDASLTNDKQRVHIAQSGFTATNNTVKVETFETPYTLTMPSAVKNSDYLPDVEIDDQYLLEFNTTDGGTNIWKTAHVKYDDN